MANDGVKILKFAKNRLESQDGKIVITCPSDPRPKHIQNPGMNPDETYTSGVSKFHRFIDVQELSSIIQRAGLEIKLWQELDYTHHKGFGVICQIAKE